LNFPLCWIGLEKYVAKLVLSTKVHELSLKACCDNLVLHPFCKFFYDNIIKIFINGIYPVLMTRYKTYIYGQFHEFVTRFLYKTDIQSLIKLRRRVIKQKFHCRIFYIVVLYILSNYGTVTADWFWDRNLENVAYVRTQRFQTCKIMSKNNWIAPNLQEIDSE